MGTKTNPGKFDCYAAALPDEPLFTLLARDPDFSALVRDWALRREHAIRSGKRPASDIDMVTEARQLADEAIIWRRANFGAWRKASD